MNLPLACSFSVENPNFSAEHFFEQRSIKELCFSLVPTILPEISDEFTALIKLTGFSQGEFCARFATVQKEIKMVWLCSNHWGI